ncbi:MAG: oligosaccharide flippase family protein [Xenococcaceae cyanobacterium MO_234.B1]|nr:oligosaccharide flippase family protein [Xenococcaceae cyanobacterium MO_234.B1]
MSSASLKKLAIRGAAWTILGYGTSQILRLGSNLVLTRLLVPELFGLMALVNVFIIGLNLFSDIGIGPSIIQNKRGEDPDFLNTAWTIQVIRGFGLWLGCLVIASPVSQFYGEPRLLQLIPIVGLTTIIQGFNSTALFTLNRQMVFGKLTIFNLGSQIVSLTVMIVWAWLNQTVWALVGGMLVGSLLKMLWSHRLDPEKPNCFAWNREIVREITSFGRWIFISTAMTFLAGQADRFILGKLFSLEMLGVYTIAFTFADIPRKVIGRISSQVLFPIFSKQADLPRKSLRAKILQKRWLILITMAFLVAVLVGFGDLVIFAFYDQRYSQAAWMLPILALGLWPLLLSLSIQKVLLAIGKPLYTACGNFLKFIYMLIGLPLGFSLMGIPGAVIVVALNDLPVYGAVIYGLWQEKLSVFVQDIQATLLLVGLLTLVLTGRYILGFGFPIFTFT